MNEEKRHVYVGSNKKWHKGQCPRRNSAEVTEELIVIEENLLRYWSTSTNYMCPECGAKTEVDN